MSMMTTGMLTVVGDKLARFAALSAADPEFSGSFNAGMAYGWAQTLSGGNAMDAYLLTLNDVDVEADLLPASRDLDEVQPKPASGFLTNVASINAMVAAINTHYRRYGFQGLDDYLTSINGTTGLTPTLRMHGHFARYLATLARYNSFVPVDRAVANFALTGATTGTYTVGTPLTTYAGAKLVVKNVGALTGTTGVTVTATKIDGTTATLTASVTVLTNGNETDLSVTSKLFVAATAVAVTGGTNGNQIDIVAKTDRSITSA